jgi:type IV pilus assembly protein PilM
VGKQVVGLKIGASQLTAACVETNGSARLLQIAREPLAEGVVAGGEVRDEGALAEALKRFFKRHKLPRRHVRIGIANNRIGVRTIDVTGIDDPKQLGNAVRFRAQEALPIPLDEAVLDYQVLAEGVDAEGATTKRILLVVAYRDLIEAYARACQQAGLRLAGVDLEAFALLRALTPAVSPLLTGNRSALVAVAVGAERSTLAVSDGYTCEFTRVLEWGGRSLTAEVARTLGLEFEAAEALKISISLDGEEVPEGFTIEQAERARGALKTGLQSFGRELVSSLQFYQSQPNSLGIREIVLAGGTAQLGGLAKVLEALVGVAVRVGDPLAVVSTSKKVKGEAPTPALTVPIGLGMGA